MYDAMTISISNQVNINISNKIVNIDAKEDKTQVTMK